MGAGSGARTAPGVSAGSGMGAAATAELLEKAALPASGERSKTDPANAGEGQFHRLRNRKSLSIDLNDEEGTNSGFMLEKASSIGPRDWKSLTIHDLNDEE